LHSVGVDDGEDSNGSIGETSVEVLLVLGPNEGGATDWGRWLHGSLLVISRNLGWVRWGLVEVDELLVWKIVDLDTFFGTNNEPVNLGGKEDDVNWGLSIDLFKMSSFDKVPDVDLSVSTTGGDEVGVWSEIKGVDLSFVSNKGVHEGHDSVIPDLDGLIPRGRDNNRLLDIVEISNAGNPVSMWVLVNGEFTNSVDIPNLDGFIDRTRGDLSVVWGESNGENILGVTNKGLVSLGSLEIPESDGSIP